MGETHAAQHVRRLGELDVVVADDLYPVAPGVAEIEERARQRLDARRRQRAADRVLVVDHDTEMAAVERQRLLDIADLESDMVETDGARFLCFRHGGSPTIRAVITW